MSDEKPKATPSAPPGPPRLERVPRPAPGAPAAPGASYGLAAREVGADAAIAAGLAHQGTLEKESALHLFALAAALQATGRLGISPEGRAYALSFRRGTVEHVASTDAADDLGAFLVRKGAVSEAQRARAEAARAAAGPGGDLAAILVAERMVNPADVASLLQEHGAALVQRALAAEGGGWSWQPDALPPPSSFPLGAPFAMLCAAVRALDSGALLRRLGDREHRAATRVGGRIRAEDLRLTPQEARAAQLFDGVRSPAELASASPGDALVVLRLALLLGEVQLLAFGASRKGAGAPAPAARPAPAAATPPTPAPAPKAAAPAPPPAKPAAPAVPPPRAPAAAAAPRPPASAAFVAARPASPAPPVAPRPAAPAPPPAPLERAALEALAKKLAGADHFEALGVKRDAAGPQIKVAYFQLAKTYHPDAVPADAPPDVRKLCADVFAKVSEAWSVLAEDASRAAYAGLLQAGGPASVDVMNIFQAENAFQAGTALVRARRYDEALARFAEAVKLNADEAEFGMWKAWCEFLLEADKKRRHAGSAAEIEAALKRNPRCAQGYLFLGQMAKLTGDLALAEKHLKRGLAVAPEHADLQRELKYLRK